MIIDEPQFENLEQGEDSQHRRKKSIIVFELHSDVPENQMLDYLRHDTLDNCHEDEDDDEQDEAKLIHMRNIIDRLSEQSSEILVVIQVFIDQSKAMRLKVSV